MRDKFNIVSLTPLLLPIRVLVDRVIGGMLAQIHGQEDKSEREGAGGGKPPFSSNSINHPLNRTQFFQNSGVTNLTEYKMRQCINVFTSRCHDDTGDRNVTT